MEVILIAAVIVGVWLVLSHIRKQQFIKEYIDLQNKALEKGVEVPGEIKDLVTAKTDWGAVSLRIGIISLILGLVGMLIGFVVLPNQTGMSDDTEALAGFWSIGMLIAAFGVGNLVCWFFIDRKKGTKTGKTE